MQTSMNNQPAPSPQPYINLQGKQICMSGLDITYRQFYNTTKDKFQYQWALIRLILKNRSKTNDENMKT